MKIFFSFFTFLFAINFLQADRAVPYTGKLSIDGINFDGTAKFKFEIVDETGKELWTNSNSSQSRAIEVTVNGGRYSVLLGGQGMNPLPPKLFLDNPNLFLKVHFDSGDGKGMRHLAPDISISANAFSLASEWSKYAELASGVPSGSITKEMLSSGLQSELDLNNSLKPMGNVHAHIVVGHNSDSSKNEIHLVNLDENRSELLASFEFPSGYWQPDNSFLNGEILSLKDSQGSMLNFDLVQRIFLSPTTYPALSSSSQKGFPYGDSHIVVGYNSDSSKNEIHSVNLVKNSNELLASFEFPSGYWQPDNSFLNGEILSLKDSQGSMLNFDLVQRIFLSPTTYPELSSSSQKGFPYGDSHIVVGHNSDSSKNEIHLVNLEDNSSELLASFEFPSGYWQPSNSFLNGEILSLKDSQGSMLNFDLVQRIFLSPTTYPELSSSSQKGFPYTYKDNVGIITKDMLSPALRTELFPPPTYESQINGTLENPYGWDGEVVEGGKDANYTVPDGKVLIVLSGQPLANGRNFKNITRGFLPSRTVVAYGDKNETQYDPIDGTNRVIRHFKNGSFTGILVDDLQSIEAIISTDTHDSNVKSTKYYIPSGKVLVVSSHNGNGIYIQGDDLGSGYSRASSQGLPAVFFGGANGKTIISSSNDTLFGSSLTGYLISPSDLKKLR